MLTVNLQPVFDQRGVHRPYAFLRSLGISHGAAHRLMKKSAVISLAHMERICRHLNCTPNELLEFSPGEGAPLGEGHALHKLVRKDGSRGNITQQLRSLPPEAVDKVWELIDGLKKGSGA